MSGARNVKGGLILLSVGLLTGLVMSLYAFEPMVPVPGSLQRYDDLPRRQIRLGHIAAVMLPLLNVVLGGWLDRLNLPSRVKQWASWLLLVGAVAVPAALFVEAVWAPARAIHLPSIPVMGFSLGMLLVSVGAWRTDFKAREAICRPSGGAAPARDEREIRATTMEIKIKAGESWLVRPSIGDSNGKECTARPEAMSHSDVLKKSTFQSPGEARR